MELSHALEATLTTARPRIDGDALVGSRCGNCGTRSWPPRATCSTCGSADVTELHLPREGALTSYTTVWVPRAGLPTPYVLGQVDLGDGASIFVHVRELSADTVVPSPVRLVMAADPEAIPRFWFEPAG